MYTKGNGKKAHRLAYSAVVSCTVMPERGKLAWGVRMADGEVYEFHAANASARDTWIRAVSDKVKAHAEAGGGVRFANTVTEAAAGAKPKAEGGEKVSKRTISFGRKKAK